MTKQEHQQLATIIQDLKRHAAQNKKDAKRGVGVWCNYCGLSISGIAAEAVAEEQRRMIQILQGLIGSKRPKKNKQNNRRKRCHDHGELDCWCQSSNEWSWQRCNCPICTLNRGTTAKS